MGDSNWLEQGRELGACSVGALRVLLLLRHVDDSLWLFLCLFCYGGGLFLLNGGFTIGRIFLYRRIVSIGFFHFLIFTLVLIVDGIVESDHRFDHSSSLRFVKFLEQGFLVLFFEFNLAIKVLPLLDQELGKNISSLPHDRLCFLFQLVFLAQPQSFHLFEQDTGSLTAHSCNNGKLRLLVLDHT